MLNACMQVPGSRDMNGEQSGVGGGNAEFSHSLHTCLRSNGKNFHR